MAFEEVLRETLATLDTEFHSVQPDRNPVGRRLKTISQRELEYVLVQYAVFSRRIVSFLIDAYYVFRYEGQTELSLEMWQNIMEELNHDGEGDVIEPHYLLLRRGFDAGLEVDVAASAMSNGTYDFINRMHALVSSPNPAYVAGCVYALEATARPELEMTYDWTRSLFRMSGSPLPADVSAFFERHIDTIEVQHEHRLRQACASIVDGSRAEIDFASGFCDVLKVMDNWWQALAAESTVVVND